MWYTIGYIMFSMLAIFYTLSTEDDQEPEEDSPKWDENDINNNHYY